MNHSLLAMDKNNYTTTVLLDIHNFHNLSVDVWRLGLWLSNLDAYLT